MRREGSLRNRASIAGIGATPFTKQSGKSEWSLAAEAVLAALEDAGISTSEVDGLVSMTADTNPETDVARTLGIGPLRFFSRVPYGGGGACALVQQAALAVGTGVARVVVCYRALNGRSGVRFGSGALSSSGLETTTEGLRYSWVAPFGALTPASWVAMFARRYLHRYGLEGPVFGPVSVSARKHASTNPHAYFFDRPISLEEYEASPWVAEPLRLLDCCQETDGGQALVVVAAEHARQLRRPPAQIRAAAQAAYRGQVSMTNFYEGSMHDLEETRLLGEGLWEQSGLGRNDIDAAIVYDHFTPFVVMQLEALGYAPEGEGTAFVREGNLDIGGSLPTNMHGGQLGEGYLHGLNGIAEAVRQVRGTAANQVPSLTHVLVTAGAGPPTSGLILGVDDSLSR